MATRASSGQTTLEWLAARTGWLFLGVLAVSPAIFGANVPLAWGLNAIGFGLFAVIYAAVQLAAGRQFPVPFRRLAAVVIPLCVLLVWIYLQTIPTMPPSWWHPSWATAAILLGQDLAGSISVNPSESRLGLLRLATTGLVFILAVQIGRERGWAHRLVAGVAVIPTLWVVAAVAARATQSSLYPFEILKRNVAYEGQLTGPFINQNHFAIYLGLGLIAAWSLFIDGLGQRSVDQGLQKARALAARIANIGGRLVMYSVLLLPLFGGILATGSRAGFLFTGFAMAAVASIALLQPSATAYRRRVILSMLGVAGFAGLFVFAINGDRVIAELSESRHASDLGPRMAVAALSLRAIADRPFLGHGYSTFADVFPAYRDGRLDVDVRWEEAHNAYIEGMLGLGVPAAMLLVLPLCWLTLRCAIGGVRRHRDQFAPMAAFGGALLVGIHALIDFSIQIQGVALLFATLLGVGYSQSWSSRDEPDRRPASRTRGPSQPASVGGALRPGGGVR